MTDYRTRSYHLIAPIVTIAVLTCRAGLFAQEQLPETVAGVFTRSCVRCHGERRASSGLNLAPETILSATAGVSSTQIPDIPLIAPGNPAGSYLIMKITGAEGIEGSRMPPGAALSESEIAIISEWISRLTSSSGGTATDLPVRAFAGWKAGNTPTAEILEQHHLLFNISHRFVPKVDEGYDQFFGFDGPAVIMLNFGYAVTPDLMLMLGRSNVRDDLEFAARYRLLRETGDMPLSLAFQTMANWESEDAPGRDRYRNNAFSYTLQIIATAQFRERFSIGIAPAVLINPNSTDSGEDPLTAIGIAGRIMLTETWSVIGDVAPIVSGFSSLRSAYSFYDDYNRFDAWTLGIERNIGVHVFQLFVTNTEGIATDRYLNGGDLDIGNGDMRLGFVIYSVIGL